MPEDDEPLDAAVDNQDNNYTTKPIEETVDRTPEQQNLYSQRKPSHQSNHTLNYSDYNSIEAA